MITRLSKIKIYFYSFFSDFFLAFAVDKLIFKETGLSVTQIAFIVSTWGGLQLLAEIPTGILSDKWNRKYMLVLAGLFFALAYISWIVFPNFWGYFLGFSIFYALAEAFLSGTDQAYIYDYLSAQNQTNDYEKIYGYFKSIRLLGVAVAWALGGLLSDLFSYEFVIFVSAISGVLCFLTGLTLPHVPKHLPAENENPFSFLKSSILYAIKHPIIFDVFLISLLIGSSFRLIDEYWAVYYNWLGFSNTVLGFLVFLAAVVGSLSGILADRLKNNSLKNIHRLTFLLTLILLLSGLIKSWILIPFLILLETIMHLTGVLSDSLIQRNAPEGRRATLASSSAFLKNMFLLTGLFFGWIVDLYSIQQGFLFAGLICLSYFLVLIFTRVKIGQKGYRKYQLVFGIIFLLFLGLFISQKKVPTINPSNIVNSSLIEYSSKYHFRQTINDCGPFNVAAVVRSLKNEEVSSAAFAEEIGWRLPNNYTLPWGMEAQLKQHGIKIQIHNLKKLSDSTKLDFLREQLSLKHPIILLGQEKGYEHYVTLFGFDSTKDEFYAYDSLGEKGEEGFTTDQNAELPGNRTFSSFQLLEFWKGGGMYGLYKWYAIVTQF